MPLLNSTIQYLNQITTIVENKNKLSIDDESIIKETFNDINKSGESYNVDEIGLGLKMRVVGIIKMSE